MELLFGVVKAIRIYKVTTPKTFSKKNQPKDSATGNNTGVNDYV